MNKRKKYPLLYIGGDKGGVGKSAVSMAVIDYLIESSEKPIVVDTDTSNPDVFYAYAKKIEPPPFALDLDTEEGWSKLVNESAHFADRPVVINAAARALQDGKLKGDGAYFLDGVESHEVIAFWVINRSRSSINALASFAKVFKGRIVIIRNTYYGAPAKFQRLAKSETTKKLIEVRKIAILDFPELPDYVVDLMDDERLTLSEVAAKYGIGERLSVRKYRADVREQFAEVLK